MLSFEVHRLLVALVSEVYGLTDAAAEPDRAAASEIRLRVKDALELVGRLEEIVGATFVVLRRHLHWMDYWHGKGSPASSDGDLASLRGPDLLAVIDAVSTWSGELLDSGLVDAIGKS